MKNQTRWLSAATSLGRTVIWVTLGVVGMVQAPAFAQILEVKPGKRAIVKETPTGDGVQFPERLEAGTRVEQIGDVPRYFEIRLVPPDYPVHVIVHRLALGV